MDIGRVYLDGVQVPKRARPLDKGKVEVLAKSIKEIGLINPIQVYAENSETAVLVAGYHRLEAVKSLGWDEVDCVFISGDEIDRELIEIAENLHRCELTVQQHSEQVARWAVLTKAKLSQVATLSKDGKGGRGKKGGIRTVGEDLGLTKDQVDRAQKIAGMTDAAKEAAKEEGLDDNQTALLAAAKKDPDDQEPEIRRQAKKRKKPASPPPDADNDFEVISKQVTALMRAWNKAGPEARKQFLDKIDTPVFDNTKAA